MIELFLKVKCNTGVSTHSCRMHLSCVVNFVTFSGICLSMTHANTVTYTKKENQYIDYQADDIIAESSAVVSHRHCSQLCTANANCTAVNYIHGTSNCQLLKTRPGDVNLIVQSGYTGYVSDRGQGMLLIPNVILHVLLLLLLLPYSSLSQRPSISN